MPGDVGINNNRVRLYFLLPVLPHRRPWIRVGQVQVPVQERLLPSEPGGAQRLQK